jgi:hypothetical protein
MENTGKGQVSEEIEILVAVHGASCSSTDRRDFVGPVNGYKY